MDIPEAATEVLTCPECLIHRPGSSARIGNRKSECRTCNRFAQMVRRRIAADLLRLHPGEAERLRSQIEPVAYRDIIRGTTAAGAGEEREER